MRQALFLSITNFLLLISLFFRQVHESSADQRRKRQEEAEKVRRLTAQLEALRQEKDRYMLRIHALEQQVGSDARLKAPLSVFVHFLARNIMRNFNTIVFGAS